MKERPTDRLPTGVLGLDEVLQGGFIPGRSYLARGGPGSGKTTLGIHYLAAGAANGERVLLICLGEPETQIRENAKAFGFDLKGITFLDLCPGPEFFAETQTYDIFSPADVERGPITRKIVEQVEKHKPGRVFIDAITQFRYLSADTFEFRRQVLSLLRFLTTQGATVLLSSESGTEVSDDDLMFLCDGVIYLESSPEGRTVSVTKFRGSGFRNGYHSLRFGSKGIEVFPRLVPESHYRELVAETIPSGVPELDRMLHGGIERGTITIITGPCGVGKTTLGLLFMKEASQRGERSALYTFEERRATLLHRSEAIKIPVHEMMERGTLSIVKVAPLQHSPDEFAHMVRQEVEERHAKIVVIDSISGYNLSLQDKDLARHLYALCKYLANMGVTTIVVNEVEAITGTFRATEQGISYLADNIIFLCYMEVRSELRKAIGVLKKRVSDFEKAMREIEITRSGVKVGDPLTGLRGILSGSPELLDLADEED